MDIIILWDSCSPLSSVVVYFTAPRLPLLLSQVGNKEKQPLRTHPRIHLSRRQAGTGSLRNHFTFGTRLGFKSGTYLRLTSRGLKTLEILVVKTSLDPQSTLRKREFTLYFLGANRIFKKL